MKIQLISPLPDRGFAFNEGVYWPVGLLSIGTLLRKSLAAVDVEILDEALIGTDGLHRRLGADIVGIQANSSLTYNRALDIARRAKLTRRGPLVVLGGPYAALKARQILDARPVVDLIVSGPGETPMLDIANAAATGSPKSNFEGIVGVWTRDSTGNVREPIALAKWDFERPRPLDYSLIPVSDYHTNYRRRFGNRSQGSFQIFTHFGCLYRDIRLRSGRRWCSYCALNERLSVRNPGDVREEICEALRATSMPHGSRLMLKCYGDNASTLGDSLSELARLIKGDAFLDHYHLEWSVYAQSSFVKQPLIEVFKELGVSEVYVGFDSVNDRIQKLNGLGTSIATHRRAARLLSNAGIRVQAGFVLGCEGETPETLRETVDFCHELRELGNVELFHASPFVVLAGSPAFDRLSEHIPDILETDYVDPDTLQREWLGRFCPGLGSGEEGQQAVREVADVIASLGVIRSSFGG